MRVSEKQRFIIANRHVDHSKEQNAQALKQLSSQKRINELHDDPVGVARIIKHKAVLSDFDNFQKNVNFSLGFTEIAESSLSSIADRLSRASELAIAMSNDTYANDSRRATAKEIEEIANQVVQLANTKYNGKSIFSGFRTDAPTLDQNGSFLGDDGAIFLQVGHEEHKRINLSGRDIFDSDEMQKEKGHMNMIHSLEVLKDAMIADDKDLIYKMVDEISFQIEKTNSFQASIGSVWQSLEQVQKRLDMSKEEEIKRISRIEDADIFQSTSDFKRTESILQSTLLASNKFLQPSLLNFMQ